MGKSCRKKSDRPAVNEFSNCASRWAVEFQAHFGCSVCISCRQNNDIIFRE